MNDAIQIREFLTLRLQFDHDIIDGAPVVRFSTELIDYLETVKGLEIYPEIELRFNRSENDPVFFSQNLTVCN